MTTFGLPRVVVNFLRHMESHKDSIRYSINEGSHKITLTLTWNFRKHKPTLWEKMQRTLRISRSMDEGNNLPEEVTKFFETSPKRQLHSPLRRQHSWHPRPQRSASVQLPDHKIPIAVTKIRRQASLNTFSPQRQASFNTFSPPPARGLTRGLSARFSWPGASSPLSIRSAPAKEEEGTTPTPSTPGGLHNGSSSPNLTRSDSTASRCSRIKLTYRSEEEIEESLEDILEKTREQTQQQLACIREEWNRSIREWPKVIDRENGALNTSSDFTDSDNETNLHVMNETVQKCLTSCDKILFRNSTLIS